MSRVVVILATFAVLSSLPRLVLADAGVPMLFLVMPAMALSLLPIIAVESYYLSRALKLPAGVAVKTATVANLVSTLVGIPLTWILLVIVQILTGGGAAYGIETLGEKILAVTWQSAWLIPYEPELHWMIPAAGLVLLVPFFLVSWWSEYLIAKRMLRDREHPALKTSVRNANLISYGLLASGLIGLLATSVS